MTENGDDSTTNGEKRQTKRCESGTSGSDMADELRDSVFQNLEAKFDLATADRDKYRQALDAIRKTLAECDTTTTQPLIDIDIVLESVGR